MSTASALSRSGQLDVTQAILKRLTERAAKGPAEPGLDAYIPEFQTVAQSLSTHVDGKVQSDATRSALLARSDAADLDVDTWLRHHHNYICVEASRRDGPNVAAAQRLYHAAFPDGLAHVDEFIPAENRSCRESLLVITSPEHAKTVTAIGLPLNWPTQWKAALDESDAAFAALQNARQKKSAHVTAGSDSTVDFLDLIKRFRQYIRSRAKRTDTAKIAEGKILLAPLLEALAKAHAEAAARATKRIHADEPAGTSTPSGSAST